MSLEASPTHAGYLAEICRRLLKSTSNPDALSRNKAHLLEFSGLPSFESDNNELQRTNPLHQLRFLIYSLVNNYDINTDFESRETKRKLMEIFNELHIPKLLGSVQLSGLLTTEVLKERIFRLSVEAENLPVLAFFLKNGISPDQHLCHYSNPCSRLHLKPLQFALLSRNLEMAKLLIDHGATLDHPGSNWKSSSIVLAVIGWHLWRWPRIWEFEDDTSPADEEDRNTITKFVKYLVRRGAAVNMAELDIDPNDPWQIFTEMNLFPVPAHQYYSPLTIAARYEFEELVSIMLDDPSFLDHSFREEELSAAYSEVLHDCIAYCSACESYNARGDGELVSVDKPQFPFKIIARLAKAGLSLNNNAVRRDHATRGKRLIDSMHITELSAYVPAWSVYTRQILGFGAKTTEKALRICAFRNNLDTFSVLFCSSDYVNKVEALGDIIKQLEPHQFNWLQYIFDQFDDDSSKLQILQLIMKSCSFEVWKSFVASSDRAASLICQHPEADGIIPALSALGPDALQEMFGNSLERLYIDPASYGELLYWSAVGDNLPLTRLLVEVGVFLDGVTRHDNDEETALCAAIRHGNEDVFKFLVGAGASFVVPTEPSCSCGHPTYANALVTAVESENTEFTCYLLERGADINGFGHSRRLSLDFWEWVPLAQNANLPICVCSCATPLTACLLNSNSQSLLLTLLAWKPNLDEWSSLLASDSKHLSPLAFLFASSTGETRYPSGAYHAHHDGDYVLQATQAFLDSGASPFDFHTLAYTGTRENENSDFQERKKAYQFLLRKFVYEVRRRMLLYTSTREPVPYNIGAVALLRAIWVQDPVLVKDMLDLRISIPSPDYHEMYPHPVVEALRYSVSEALRNERYCVSRPPGSSEFYIVKLLLEAGYKPRDLELGYDLHTPCGYSYPDFKLGYDLHIPCGYSYLDLEFGYGSRYLTYNRRRYNSVKLWRRPVWLSPLFLAILFREVDIARLLLEAGVRYTPFMSNYDRCLFQYAILVHDELEELFELLFEHNMRPRSAPLSSGTHESYEGERKYVPKGLINVTLENAFQSAVFKNMGSLVRLMIDKGVDINAAGNERDGATALQLSLMAKHYEIAELLIARGADTNAPPSSYSGATYSGATCLQIACGDGNLALVRLLIENGAQVNAEPGTTLHRRNRRTALHHPIKAGSLELVRYLVSHGADINASSPSGYHRATAIQVACAGGNLSLVKFLIKQGADVNAEPGVVENTGTALQLAVSSGSYETVRYLVDHGADVNALPERCAGATALQFAALHGFLTIAEFLIRRGADIHAKGAEKDGMTALEGAASGGRADMVGLFLAHIDVDAVTGAERENIISACRSAEQNGHWAIRHFIRAHLAEG